MRTTAAVLATLLTVGILGLGIDLLRRDIPAWPFFFTLAAATAVGGYIFLELTKEDP